MKDLNISILISSLIYFSGCSNNRGFENGNDRIIEEEGKYQLKDNYELSIKVNRGLVTYNIVDLSDSVILSNAESISTYQKWYFYYESISQSLWIWSSDIGLLLWRKNKDAEYIERYVNRKDSLNLLIPPSIYREMPSSAK